MFWLFLELQRAKQLTTQKEAGNGAFRGGKFQDAYDLYTQALQIDPHNRSTNSKLYNNRATVSAKVGGVCALAPALYVCITSNSCFRYVHILMLEKNHIEEIYWVEACKSFLKIYKLLCVL